MPLHTRRWGPPGPDAVVCIHGLTQHGGVYEELGKRLAADGRSVVALDLRGHGSSLREPPWDIATHVDDVLETLDELGIERVTWIGHSFGGRIVAEAALRAPERTDRLVMLDPGLEIPADWALRSAEIDRLDWSFASVEGAVNALMAGESVIAAPEATVAAYVRDDLQRGPDGRLRFSACPSATVVAWSEMTRPAPEIAQLPTLVVRAAVPLTDGRAQDLRYRKALGSLLTLVAVPNGHNVLWESPAETFAAIEGFLARDAATAA
jgi:pimeloyl-ACP methyl ester carboxylesterase